MKKTVIKSTGRYIPSRLVTNEELTTMMDTTDEWIQQRTGIRQRYWVDADKTTGSSDLGLEAAKIAIDKAGWKPEDLDLIIFATLSPDIFFPGSGCLLQHKLGLSSTPTIDIRQQCTGFIYGQSMADAYIKSGMAEKVLFVGAEVHSTGLDKTTRGRDVAVLFGDGAAAVCYEGVDTDSDVGVISSVLHTDGKFAESLMLELPASRIWERGLLDDPDISRLYPQMNGTKIFKLALRRLPEVTNEIFEKTGMTLDDIDLIIPHQANLRINEAYQQIMNIPEEKIYNNIQKYGNTTAATIPLALDEVIEKGLINTEKSTLLFVALGAGLTWAASIYKFG